MRGAVRDTTRRFDTSPWYAPFYGWLIVPTIMTLLTFIGAIIMVVFVRPADLAGFDLAIYAMDVFNLIYLFITYLFWISRKRILPTLMIVFFVIMSIWHIVMYSFDVPISYIDFIISIIWIFYFARSERVKQIFIR